MSQKIFDIQLEVCGRYMVSPVPAPAALKVGISLTVRDAVQPINGLRCRPEGDTSGWYIWAGEWSDDPRFFVPLHIAHLDVWCPQAMRFLQLPPGWRFLIAPGYEDAWADPKLIEDGKEGDERTGA